MSIFEYDEEKHMRCLREEGFADGVEQERKRMNQLNKKLIEASRWDDLEKSLDDKEYQEKLFEEFGL